MAASEISLADITFPEWLVGLVVTEEREEGLLRESCGLEDRDEDDNEGNEGNDGDDDDDEDDDDVNDDDDEERAAATAEALL